MKQQWGTIVSTRRPVDKALRPVVWVANLIVVLLVYSVGAGLLFRHSQSLGGAICTSILSGDLPLTPNQSEVKHPGWPPAAKRRSSGSSSAQNTQQPA